MPTLSFSRHFFAAAFGLLFAAAVTASTPEVSETAEPFSNAPFGFREATPPEMNEATDPELTPSPVAAAPRKSLSSTAEQIYTQARPRLLQIRTLVVAAKNQSSIGSGFLIDPEGFVLTNYHVVSQHALEPQTYQLDYLAPDGTRGRLHLHAIDIVNDLAVVRMVPPDNTEDSAPSPRDHFTFNPKAIADELPKGERLFAMGNPHDLGFTIVEGTYNGFVENSYQQRIHFTGALNPGMSGGPAVTADNRIAGVNVSKQYGSDLVSFLVPADVAHALVEKARNNEAMSPDSVRESIREQLDAWQNDFFIALKKEGFKKASFGSYQAEESKAPWFRCWASTNSNERPRPRALEDSTACNTRTHLFLAGNMNSGYANISHSYIRSVDLNAFQFATYLSQNMWVRLLFGPPRHYTAQQCYENFLASDQAHPKRPPLRVTWCARAYRDFADLYDVSLAAVTQNSSKEALVSRLYLTGVSYPNAMDFTKQFLNTIEVSE